VYPFLQSLGREQLLGARALEREQRKLECAVLDLHARRRVLPKPIQVMLAVRCVDDDEKTFAASVDDEVVDDPTRLVAEQAVLRLAVDERAEIVGDQALQEVEAGVAGDAKAAHVRHVEEARDSSHCEMLVADRAVLLGHLPPPEVDHAAAEGDVLVVERSALQRAIRRQPCRRSRWCPGR